MKKLFMAIALIATVGQMSADFDTQLNAEIRGAFRGQSNMASQAKSRTSGNGSMYNTAAEKMVRKGSKQLTSKQIAAKNQAALMKHINTLKAQALQQYEDGDMADVF